MRRKPVTAALTFVLALGIPLLAVLATYMPVRQPLVEQARSETLRRENDQRLADGFLALEARHWKHQHARGGAAARSVKRRLSRWLRDPAFEKLRSPDSLDALPPTERRAWKAARATIRQLASS